MARLTLITSLALVCWGMFAAGFWVGHATAATGQELSDALSECIARSVGAPPIYRTLVPGDTFAALPDGSQIVGQVTGDRPNEAAIYPEMLWSFQRAAAGRPRGPWTAEAFATVMHELIHRAPLTWDRDGFDPFLEEGVTEAMTMDLLPVCSRRVLGEAIYTWEVDHAYPEAVAYIRTTSARATGSSWRSRAARLWRRTFYLASRWERWALIPERGGA